MKTARSRSAYWANATEANDTDPQIFTDDLADIFFRNDREAFTIAFVPEGEDILPPTTVGDLDALAGIDGGEHRDQHGARTGSTRARWRRRRPRRPAGEPSASTTAPTTTAPPAG